MNLLLCILLIFQHVAKTEPGFSAYFGDSGVRFYYSISGAYGHEKIKPVSLNHERSWSGSKVNLMDTFGYGNFLLEIHDYQTKKLIYSCPYNNLFSEWQMSDTSGADTMSFNECVSFPLPHKQFVVQISRRDSLNYFYPVFTLIVNPEEIEPKLNPPAKPLIQKVLMNGSPETKLDIVFFAEGYTAAEKSKFFADAERFSNYLNNWQPFARNMEHINILAVFVPSNQAGVDIPQDKTEVNTVCNATFRTFGIDRYLSVPDISIVYKYLGEIPCDQLCILANSNEYGGGGIYNFYTLFTTGNKYSEFLFLHEFAHGFAALGDEYFIGEVSYMDTGLPSVEPYEANITSLIDFDKKWKDMVADTIPVPTPLNDAYRNAVGAFEGANYRAKGYYRPQQSCAMLSSEETRFCKVCERSIEQFIWFYSK